MAEFPSMPIFANDALEDTAYLLPEQTGAYFSLMLATWLAPDCGLPDDDGKLMLRARCDPATWARVKHDVLAFWKRCEDGRLRHPGLTKAREFAIKNREAKRKGAAKTNETRWGGDRGTDVPAGDPNAERNADRVGERPAEQVAQQSLSSSSSSSSSSPSSSEKERADSALPSPPAVSRKRVKAVSPEPYSDDFEKFWKDYPKRKDDSKKKAFEAWLRLKPEQRIDAAAAVPNYKAAKNGEYVHNASNYLADLHFEGHVPKPKPVDWETRLKLARQRCAWDVVAWGPFPHSTGCVVPPDLLLPGDGQNWQAKDQVKGWDAHPVVWPRPSIPTADKQQGTQS